MSAAGPNKEFLISETLIPDIFIARYMPLLGKEAISIYLWTHMTFKGESFTYKDTVAYGAIPEEDLKIALAELVAAGVLVRKENDVYEPVDLKMVEVEEYIRNRTDADGVPVMKSDEKKRQLLAVSIQKTYYQGHMAYAFYRLIDKCLYEYKFEDGVVYSLFEEGKELRVHYIVAKMYDLAQKWYQKGYTSTESLKEYYELRTRRSEVAKVTGKLLRKRLTEMDYEHINTWATDYKADAAIVEYAIRCLDYKNNIRMVDVTNKLKEWFDAGVMTVDKAMVYEAERHKENKAKASRSRGRTNVRKSGKDAGITVESKEEKPEAKPEDAETQTEELKPAADETEHDSILDMFSGDDDEDN